MRTKARWVGIPVVDQAQEIGEHLMGIPAAEACEARQELSQISTQLIRERNMGDGNLGWVDRRRFSNSVCCDSVLLSGVGINHN